MSYNVGESNYAEMTIQPWEIFEAHPQLNYWECDIIKRLLRTKETDGRMLDLQKIKHLTEHLIYLEDKKLKIDSPGVVGMETTPNSGVYRTHEAEVIK